MLKIAVIGGADTVIGFKALGLDTFGVATLDEARDALHRLTRESEDYAIIYIEEVLAQELQHEIDRYKERQEAYAKRLEGRTANLRAMLLLYFGTVPVKEYCQMLWS